jgi:hypothetical protein
VGKVFTQVLSIKNTWVGTTEGRSISVKHVGRNSQRRGDWYAIGKFMILKVNASHVKHVVKAFT